MKRTAAVIGPTPRFVRWCIDRPCELREPGTTADPNATFRQLRSIRALSRGMTSRRVYNGICFHPSVLKTDSDTVRGFPVDEILAVSGGQQEIENNCDHCPANAARLSPLDWAGCYGWLSADPYWTPDSDSRNHVPVETLPGLFEQIARDEKLPTLRRSEPVTNPEQKSPGQTVPVWGSLWSTGVVCTERLRWLRAILAQLPEAPGRAVGVLHLQSAVDRCLENDLTFIAEQVPAGVSDGVTWRLHRHCSFCKTSAPPAQNVCANCRKRGGFIEERKLKVLGLRPYLELKSIFGADQADQLRRTFTQWYNAE